MKTVLNMASLGLSSPTWRLGQDSYTSLSLPKIFNFSPIQLVVVFSMIYYYVLHNHHLQMLIIVTVILDLYIVQAQKWGRKGDRGIQGGKEPNHYFNYSGTVYLNAKKIMKYLSKHSSLIKLPLNNYCKQIQGLKLIVKNPGHQSHLYLDITAWRNGRNLKKNNHKQ